jgi:putative hydrolase of HD superfamily
MQDLVDFFYELGTLRRMQRSYNLNILQDTESVAEHSHRVSIIAYLLAKKVGVDPYKTLLMAIFHDIAETRTGDSNWVQKSYLKQDEEKATKSQLKLMDDLGIELEEILIEYKKRESLESQVAKDADYLDYFLSLRELAMTGNIEAERRLNSENTSLDHMYTDEGKKLAKMIKETDPTEWTRKDLVESHDKYTNE